MHARTGDGLVHVKQGLTLAKAINQDVHRTTIKPVRTQPEQVIEQARDLRKHHPDVLCAHRHINTNEFFYGQAVGMLVGHHRHIVETVHVGQRLDVGLALGQLFCGAMQQADVRISALDDFAVELEHKAQYTMGSRMLRPEVKRVVFDFSHIWFCFDLSRRA